MESPLLNDSVDGAVDYKNRPVLRSKSGCWRSSYFIIGVEVAERFAYYGVSSNLIMYLTGPLGQSTATAAENVNVWSGTASLLPLVGAFIADAFLGRYLTVVIASLLYILALALLAFSTLIPTNCENAIGSSSCSQLQVIMFFHFTISCGICTRRSQTLCSGFWADQFDDDNPEERKAKSSFFNWWYFGLCAGPTVGIFVLTYIQDNLSWGLGFGIPCIITEEEAFGFLPYQGSQQFKFLDKALLSPDGSNEDGTLSIIDDVEETKVILRLAPIWISCLGYGIVFAQTSTFFTKQGATMDRSIGSTFLIPAATLQSFIGISIITLIPIYDAVLVPLVRVVTKRPSGITMLQRIGTGIFISIVSMLVAAVIETKRLETAREYGLLDDPNAMVPMKIWWLLPQYLLAGAGDVFAIVGMQEFFYDQMPSDLRSIGLALYLSVIGFYSFLSSFLISIVKNNRWKWVRWQNLTYIIEGEPCDVADTVAVICLPFYLTPPNQVTLPPFMDATTTAAEISCPLLNDFVDGAVDYKNRPVLRSKSGCWRSSYFIIGVESTATAAENTNMWSGTALLLPIDDVEEMEEVKAVLRLVPIWASLLGCAIVFAQTSTLYTKQAAALDRSIGSSFEVPAATLQAFITLFIIILISIYNTMLVPLRAITNKPSGIALLQRIGTGIVFSILLMVVAAIVETKRLKTAYEYGLVDDPSATIPMKVWWLLPQCLLAGESDVFTIVGMQEFFCEEMPNDLKSIGLALYLSVLGIGSLLSSVLFSIVEKLTCGNGQDGWISENVNKGHIDYFYYLLAGISAGAFMIYIYAAKCYVYNRGRAL
ncbi:proton-dependent oligopeptide transporter family protein [Tanacetum coccineum]